MSFIFYYVLAFYLRTVRDILIGISYGLLQEMNFSQSRCTLRAQISLFLRQRANYISSFIFQGGDPRGTYFQASWLKQTLQLALKLSASDMDWPFRNDVSFEEDEQVLTFASVLSLLPKGLRFFLLFFQPYSPPAQFLLIPSIQKVGQRSRASGQCFPFMRSIDYNYKKKVRAENVQNIQVSGPNNLLKQFF